MSIERELLLHLPRLRRYAQALCCARQAGDELLMDTVRQLDLVGLVQHDCMLLALFRLVNETATAAAQKTRVKSGVRPSDFQRDEPIPETAADNFGHRLEALDIQARQAFLLIAQQGLPPALAATILRLDQVAFDALYSRSESAVLRRNSADVLIIEDDVFVSADLGQIMQSLGHSIAGIASTCQQAVHLAERHRPGLILCDISLVDGSSGIDAVNQIVGCDDVPVVFITSHPDRLATSTENGTANLIRKPYSAEQIRTVSSQVLYHRGSRTVDYADSVAA